MTATGVPKVPQCTWCNETPYLFAPMVGTGLGAGYTMTVVVKASYRLVPGQPLIPLEPQAPFRGDQWPGEDFRGALRHGTDLVQWKPRCDLLLRASCHAPEGRPVATLGAGFAVGAWSKAVTVFGDRTWKVGLFERTPGEPQPFSSMPLDWEHAYGGSEYPDNPAGKGFRGDLLPNVEYADQPVRKYGGKVPPASFLPLNRMWAARMAKMGSADGSYLAKRFPLPPGDFDWGYYNEAPADQQLEHYLRGDEELRFSNLHPQHPDWSARLPGKRVRCFVGDSDEQGAYRVREAEMNCDTLLANVEEGYLHLLWRGLLPVRSEDRSEVTRFYVVEEPLAGPAKPLARHVADMAVALDLGGKLAAKVADEVDAVRSRTAGILARYGLSMPSPQANIGPSDEQLAAFPFNPKGALPPSAAAFQSHIDRLGPLRAKALEQLRTLGKGHGVDIDAVPPAKTVDILAMRRKGLEDASALLRAHGKEVPDAITLQLAKLDSSDPLGIVAMAEKFKAAGIDAAANGDPLLVAFAAGDTAAFLTAAQQQQRGPLDGPIPGASPAPPPAGAAAPPPAPPAPAPAPASVHVPTPAAAAATASGGAPGAVVAGAGAPLSRAKPRPPGGVGREEILGRLASGGSFAGGNYFAGDFSGLDLHGQDFSKAQLIHADFRRANLAGCTFSTALLRHADLGGADLRGATLGFCDYTGADFSAADLSGATLTHAAFAACFFVAANLRGAELSEVMMDGVDLTGVDLRGATVDKGVWQKSILRRAQAADSSWLTLLLSECALDDGDFSRATMNDTVLMTCSAQRLRLVEGRLTGLRAFNGTDLQGALMVGAKMPGTSWMYVRLDDADFSQGDLRGANLMFSSAIKARFVKADLKSAMLRHGNFEAADFQRANLCKASFGLADLRLANLSMCNCYQTDFQDANLMNTRFDQANLLRSNVRRG
jgi:uncharacterized protein YjbI with pentapeptide repeats